MTHPSVDHRSTSRQLMIVLSVAAAVAACVGCEGEPGLASDDFSALRGGRRSCTGAFTPHSEACWEDPGDGGASEISANLADSQEKLARLGEERCLAGLIGAPGTPGELTVTFTTTVTGGLYSPRNCGAVWVEDSLSFYQRTLELWTAERQMSIVQWNASACHKDPTLADVITSATLDGPSTHTAKWDMKDFRGNLVPDGKYTLWMQVAETEISPEGPFVSIDFIKDAKGFALPPRDAPGFKGIAVTFQPAPIQ